MRPVRKHILIYLIGAFLIFSFSVIYIVTNVIAAPVEQASQNLTGAQVLPVVTDTAPIVSNETCLGCHGKPGLTMSLLNGDVLDLYVNPAIYSASIHGQDGYACVQCHTNLGAYPHPLFTATDLRDATLRLTNLCDRCHSGEYNLTMDSVHFDKLAIGIRQAAVCTDCHGSHDVHQWTDPKTHALLPAARLSIPVTCSKCHYDIYQKYRASVHGAALTDQANTDVPTCISCHGVHNIGNPTTAAFRLKSPELCASCHTNPTLMDKYGISTNVLNTYVADFHGTTVTLFEKQSPDAQTNKPVCYDCHGVHDISRVNDPKTGIEMQQNLLVRCKVCHPDATSNFPSAWMSHYIPSPNHYSLVYYVNLFYKFFIPMVLGGMVALVGLDVGHSVYVKNRRGNHLPQYPPAEVQPSSGSESPTQLSSDAEAPAQPPLEQESPSNPSQIEHNVELNIELREQSEQNKLDEQSAQSEQNEEAKQDEQRKHPDDEVSHE
jgi:hypothetical protein